MSVQRVQTKDLPRKFGAVSPVTRDSQKGGWEERDLKLVHRTNAMHKRRRQAPVRKESWSKSG